MIFFDIDDTLFDHSGAERDAVHEFYRKHHDLFTESADAFFLRWRSHTKEYLQRYWRGDLSFDRQRRARIKILFSQFGMDVKDEQADKLFSYYLDVYKSHWRLFPDALPCLERLRNNHLLGIISNGESREQRQKLEETGIISFFSSIIISSEVDMAKPDPEIFLHACDTLDFPPHRCIHVGNSLDFDAMGARSAGLKGVWLNRSEPLDTAAEISVIHSLDELDGLTHEI